MAQETLKLSLIERLINEEDEAVLKRFEQLITKAQMEANAQESVTAIEKENTISLEEFHLSISHWMKQKHTQ